jgi:mxaC protein
VPFDFDHPAALALLPLAALPFLRRHGDTLLFSSIALLPADAVGTLLVWARRVLAALAIAAIVIGLASPGRSGAQLQRFGRGAEVMLLMDRSSSMDAVISGRGTMAETSSTAGPKSKIARDLLTQFVTRRPNDRFALTTFSTGVMPVAPFTDHNQAVLAGLAATEIGRGLPHTDMGSALLAAIDAFHERRYSGSRIILLVSDGGAKLDDDTRQRIQAGLSRNRIGLYYIYIRSSVISPNLNVDIPADADESEELSLHRFFLSLPTPYHLYQADDSGAMANALADIDRQQNLPLIFLERVPRQDHSDGFFTAALLACLLLLAGGSIQLRAWARGHA